MASVARVISGVLPAPAAAIAPGLDIAEIAIVTEPAAIEAEWRRFEATARGHVFQTFDFLSPWLAHVARERDVEPRIVLGRDRSGALLFLLPFGLRRCLGTRMLEWLGGEHADYHCGLYAPRFLAYVAADSSRAAALVRMVVGLFRGEADIVNLHRQPVKIDGETNPFAAYAAIPHATRSHLTRLGHDWETYYRAKRNSSSRRHDRSKRQKMEAMGRIAIFDATSAADIRRVTGALFAQKERSLSGQGIADFFASPGVRAFYEAIASKPYPAGPGHVSALTCDDAVVATNWGLVRGDRYYYVMHSYSGGEIGRSSPGRHLMYHLMQWCIGHGIGIFDFTIGDEEFKSQWCEESAELYDSVAPLNLAGMPLAVVLRVGKGLKRLIKQNAGLHALAGYARRSLAGWKA